MNYILNFRFLIKVAVGVVALLGGTYALHRWQTGKQVELFRSLADAARREAEAPGGDPRKLDEEIVYRARYLAMRPDDVDARERLGRVRFERARTPADALSAYFGLEDALRRDRSRAGLERFLVDVALDPRLMLVDEAVGHIDRLLAAAPTDGGLLLRRGECFEAAGDAVAAAERYEQAFRSKPDEVDAYWRLATVLRRVKDPAAAGRIRSRLAAARAQGPEAQLPAVADAVIADLLAKNPQDYRAHLAAAGYYRAANMARPAREAALAALRLAPDEAPVLLAAVTAERDQARDLRTVSRSLPGYPGTAALAAAEAAQGRARAAADRGVRLHPTAPALHLARAEVESDVGQLQAAEGVLERATTQLPEAAELWTALVDVRVARKDAPGAAAAAGRFRELGAAAPLADYQDARINVLRGNWTEAAKTLSHVRDDLANTAYARPANLLLARCYEQVGELDRRMEAFGRVLAVKDVSDPLTIQAMAGMAEARAALGQTDAALELYQVLAAANPTAWLAVARLRLTQAVQQPPEARDLRPVEDAVRRAERAVRPDTTNLVLLRADLAYLQNDSARARQLLTDLQKTRGTDVAVWVALAVQDLRDKDAGQARATLDEAQARLGDSVDLRLARARLTVDPKAPDAADRWTALGPPGPPTFTTADRVRLARALGEIALAGGQPALTDRLWTRAAELAPYDMSLQLRRFDRAVNKGDLAAAGAIVKDIEAVDGVDGTSHKTALALYKLRQAQADPANAAVRDEADRLLEDLEAQRPGWSRIALGQAVIADLRHEPDKAIARYQKAVDQGEQEPEVVRRLVELYRAAGRFGDAQLALDKLPPAVLGTADVSRLATEVNLMSRRPDQAIKSATRAIKPDSMDYRDQLWLATVYWQAKAKDKWEAPLRRAVRGAKGDPVPLITLVELLAADGRRPEAEAALTEFGGAVAPDQRAFARARCLQLLGRTDDARAAYEQAARERPDDVRLLQNYAGFLMTEGNYADAAGRLRRVAEMQVATADERKQARLWISICQTRDPKGNYQESRDALRRALEEVHLLDGGHLDGGGEAKPDDLRYAAVVLAQQVDRASKADAIRHLERLEAALRKSNRSLTPNDRLLWARLHAALNQPDDAKVRFQQALSEDPKNPLILSQYAEFLLRLRRPDLLAEAERQVKEFQAVQPDSVRAAELGARLAVAQGKPEAARRLLNPLDDKPGTRPGALAAVYEELGLFDDAGRLYQAVATRAKRPESLLSYAAFLGRRQETDKALERCDEARRQNCPPAAATGTAVMVLYAAREPRPAAIDRVLGWVGEALAAAGNQPAVVVDLMHHQAALLNLKGDYAQAISVYERVLALKPGPDAAGLTMNNLGFLVGVHRGDSPAALKWLEGAKRLKGPLPELLDTEALIHLESAKRATTSAARRESTEAALRLLADVEAQSPKAATYFHLAMARMAKARLETGRAAVLARDEARRAWDEARRLNLAVAEIHPLERPDYEDLRREFGG